MRMDALKCYMRILMIKNKFSIDLEKKTLGKNFRKEIIFGID